MRNRATPCATSARSHRTPGGGQIHTRVITCHKVRADEVLSVVRTSGKLLERVEKLDWSLRPLYAAGVDEDQQPTFDDLGVLAWFVSAMECDLKSIEECVASLARVHDDRLAGTSLADELERAALGLRPPSAAHLE